MQISAYGPDQPFTCFIVSLHAYKTIAFFIMRNCEFIKYF